MKFISALRGVAFAAAWCSFIAMFAALIVSYIQKCEKAFRVELKFRRGK